MILPGGLRERVLEDEWMDDPRLGRAAHVRALRGLTRINWISAAVRPVWTRVRRAAQSGDAPLRVLDVATGGGDLPLGLAHGARRAGLDIEVAGCDISRRAVAYARTRARQAQIAVHFFVRDALADGLPEGYDVITSALFLHHLRDEQIVTLLQAMRAAARQAVLVDDLRRSRLGFAAAFLGTRMLTRSRVVHVDGIRSVRAALTAPELSRLAAAAELTNHRVVPHWPWRQLLEWWR